MTVREAEALAVEAKPRGRSAAKAAEKDADTRALEKALSDGLGLEVSIATRRAAASFASATGRSSSSTTSAAACAARFRLRLAPTAASRLSVWPITSSVIALLSRLSTIAWSTLARARSMRRHRPKRDLRATAALRRKKSGGSRWAIAASTEAPRSTAARARWRNEKWRRTAPAMTKPGVPEATSRR